MNSVTCEPGPTGVACVADVGHAAAGRNVAVPPGVVVRAGESRDAIASAAPPPAAIATGRGYFASAIARQPRTGTDLPTASGLPIPALANAVPSAGIRCVVTLLDRDGRLADRSAVSFANWPAGRAVNLVVEPGPILVARPGGDLCITARGHLRVPLALRRVCRIGTGDRVLLVADRRRGELLVIPMATLHDMIIAWFGSYDGGGEP
jgi:hypothetical protein